MAEAEVKPAAEAQPRKKPPLKLVAIVAGVMIAEAAGVYFVVSSLGHKPESASAKGLKSDHAELEKPVELALVDDKFQNMSSGKAWMWDVSMFLQVKKKNEEAVKGDLKAREAEIREGIAMIFRKATLNQLKEPGLETLNRQILAFVNRIIEADPEGAARVDRILIPKCRGFAID